MKNYILIMGLGLNKGGLGVAEYFAKKGENVLVTDLKSENELRPSIHALNKYKNIEFVLGKHDAKDFKSAKLVIANPGVPPNNQYVKIAKQAGVTAHTEMSYFFEQKQCKVIGITGTRGKSTTTSLTYQIFDAAGQDVFLGGNLGISVMEALDESYRDKLGILEISNYMLEWMRVYKQSPEEALITNIMRDHLNRHGTLEEYIDVKSTIFRFQGPDDTAYVNVGNKLTKPFATSVSGKVIAFGENELESNFAVKQDTIFEGKKKLFNLKEVLDSEMHALAGEHNKLNILAAVAVARTHGINTDIIRDTIKNYKSLYGRQMYIGNINGIDIINDTCATMPDAVLAALKRFSDRSIILITGGTDKELDYTELAKYLKDNPVKAVVVLSGTGSTKLLKKLKKVNAEIEIDAEKPTLQAAVNSAFAKTTKGDLVLFSPGGTSFELFKNEFDRGERFDKIIKALKK